VKEKILQAGNKRAGKLPNSIASSAGFVSTRKSRRLRGNWEPMGLIISFHPDIGRPVRNQLPGRLVTSGTARPGVLTPTDINPHQKYHK